MDELSLGAADPTPRPISREPFSIGLPSLTFFSEPDTTISRGQQSAPYIPFIPSPSAGAFSSSHLPSRHSFHTRQLNHPLCNIFLSSLSVAPPRTNPPRESSEQRCIRVNFWTTYPCAAVIFGRLLFSSILPTFCAMKTFNILTSALTGTALLASSVLGELDPIVIKVSPKAEIFFNTMWAAL